MKILICTLIFLFTAAAGFANTARMNALGLPAWAAEDDMEAFNVSPALIVRQKGLKINTDLNAQLSSSQKDAAAQDIVNQQVQQYYQFNIPVSVLYGADTFGFGVIYQPQLSLQNKTSEVKSNGQQIYNMKDVEVETSLINLGLLGGLRLGGVFDGGLEVKVLSWGKSNDFSEIESGTNSGIEYLSGSWSFLFRTGLNMRMDHGYAGVVLGYLQSVQSNTNLFDAQDSSRIINRVNGGFYLQTDGWSGTLNGSWQKENGIGDYYADDYTTLRDNYVLTGGLCRNISIGSELSIYLGGELSADYYHFQVDYSTSPVTSWNVISKGSLKLFAAAEAMIITNLTLRLGVSTSLLEPQWTSSALNSRPNFYFNWLYNWKYTCGLGWAITDGLTLDANWLMAPLVSGYQTEYGVDNSALIKTGAYSSAFMESETKDTSWNLQTGVTLTYHF